MSKQSNLLIISTEEKMKKSALVSTYTENFESILKVLNETSEIDLESILVNEFEQRLPSNINFCF